MNRYIKILLITLGIQIGFLFVAYLLYNVPIATVILRKIGLSLFIINIPISIIIGIVLAIKWGATIREKLIYIFLMPTNYTWIIYILMFGWLMGKIGYVLTNIPDNFG